MAEKLKRPAWITAAPQHDWPDGDYIGGVCDTCGVVGFRHPKRAPHYCWPHWQEAERNAEWRRAKWEAGMIAEFGPYTPKPSPFAPPRPGEYR